MLTILLESTETRCIFSWMRMKLRRIRGGERAAVSFVPGGGLRLIRIDGSSDPEPKLR